MGKFYTLKTDSDFDWLIENVRKLAMSAERVEMSFDNLDGLVSSPTKRHRLFRVSMGFAAEQFDKMEREVNRKSISEIENGTVLGIVFVGKKRE